MYKCINGWTKDKMITHILSEFKGKSAIVKKDRINCLYRGPGQTNVRLDYSFPTNYTKKKPTLAKTAMLGCMAMLNYVTLNLLIVISKTLMIY